MRLSFIFCLLSVMHLSASVYSQNTTFTFSLKDQTIREILNVIENQSEYRFIYNDKFIDMERVTSVGVKNKSIADVLNQVFSNSAITYQVLENNMIVITPREMAPQQGKRITGTVIDEKGESVIGANVVEKGTTNGKMTDVNGQFVLDVSPDATLIVSYIGYNIQQVTVGNQTNLTITLTENTSALEEVVVVGYGTQKKVNLTGAVASIKVDETLSNRTLSNVSSGLQGLLPGLAVSQNSGMAGKNDITLMIRGLGTVNNADPLIVVDGMPDVDINRINMNDIESVSVLKDAASSAIYGSRAANGVILITTKTGKGSKTNVNFSASHAISNPVQKMKFMADYPRALTVQQRAAAVNTLPSNQNFKNGTIDQWMALGMIDPLRYPNTDWWDIIIRQGSVQNYNLSASGSNEKSNFFASIGLMDEKGLQLNNDYDRYNARFNYNYKVRNSINIGIKFDGNWSKYIYALPDGFTSNDAQYDHDIVVSAISGMVPYDPVTGYYGGVMAYNESTTAYNPLVDAERGLTRQNRQESNASMYLDWSPIKGLTAYIDYALSYYNQFRYVAKIPTRSYNFQTDSFGPRTYIEESAPIQNNTNTGYKTQLTGHLNYQTTIASHHDIGILFAYSEEYWYNRNQSASRNDRIFPSLHEIDAALTDTQSNGGSSNTEGLRSYIGRMNYAACNKYLLELNFRVDGSSKFLSSSQYGFFPSASVGWRFSEEGFLKSVTKQWLTQGKLRTSYGSLGNNSGVGRYEQQETLASSNYVIGGVVVKGFTNNKMVNRDLTWEATTVMNIGLDLGFLNNRLFAELDYYDRLTTGMNRPSDLSIHLTGAYNPPPRKNIGNLRNRGVEANFTWRDRENDFKYVINLNASYNKSKLEKWNEYLGKGYTFINMPYHFVYSYEAIGIAQTWEDIYSATPQGAIPGDILYKDINGDGRIDGNDRVAYPNYQQDRPSTNFGLNSHFEWKGIDLALMLQGALGRKTFWLPSYNNTTIQAQRRATLWDHWDNSWTLDNRNAELPRMRPDTDGGDNRRESTYWLDNLNYLRLKNAQIGYALPKRWIRKLYIDNIRIYGSGENILTFTKYRGLDPEKESGVNDVYPLVRSFSIGINIGI